MTEVGQRIEILREKMTQACERAGRAVDSVQLIAVSKRQPMDRLIAAYDAGLRDFGENYAQALSQRAQELPGDIRWHMIGHLQSNKAKLLAGQVDLLHTLHSAKLARVFGQLTSKPTSALIQVNVGDESQKSGVAIQDLAPLLEVLSNQNHVQVKGFMTIPPQDDTPRRWYGNLRELRDEMVPRFDFDLSTLSMGMSGDFEEAIQEGATLIRVGTQVFGFAASLISL